MYPVYPFVSDIHICHLFQSICTKNTKAICQKKQLRGLIKSYQDVLNQPLPQKHGPSPFRSPKWLSPVPGSHGGCQMLEGQELPFLGRLHLQQVADQTVFEDSAEAEELHVEQVAWGNTLQ